MSVRDSVPVPGDAPARRLRNFHPLRTVSCTVPRTVEAPLYSRTIVWSHGEGQTEPGGGGRRTLRHGSRGTRHANRPPGPQCRGAVNAAWMLRGKEARQSRRAGSGLGNLAWRLQSAITIPHGGVSWRSMYGPGHISLILDTSATGAKPTEPSERVLPVCCVPGFVCGVTGGGQRRTEPLEAA